MSKEQKPRTGLLRRVLVCLGVLAAAVLFWGLTVLLQPGETAADKRADQQPLAAAASRSISSLEELEGLVKEFPAPALLAASGLGLTLQGAAIYDKPFEDGVGRVLRLIYRDESGNSIQLDSITPARALSLLDSGGYRLSGTMGHNVAGHRTVRMENSSYIRLHMQTEDGLYAITVPRESVGSLASLVRPLMLYSEE